MKNQCQKIKHKLFECSICNKKFLQESSIKKHMELIHSNIRPEIIELISTDINSADNLPITI